MSGQSIYLTDSSYAEDRLHYVYLTDSIYAEGELKVDIETQEIEYVNLTQVTLSVEPGKQFKLPVESLPKDLTKFIELKLAEALYDELTGDYDE